MSNAGQGWSGKSKGTPLGYRIFNVTIRTLGVRTAYLLLYFVTPWYVLTSRASNAALRKYFSTLRQWDPSIKGLTLFGSYMSFGRVLIDKAAFHAGLADRFTWSHDGHGHITDMIAGGQGGLLISAHLGNWELASRLLNDLEGHITVVLMQADDIRLQRAMDAAPEKRYDTIALGSDLAHVFRMDEALRAGRVLCMHGDRNLPNARVHRVAFLGRPAAFPLGPFALAAARQVPVCVTFVVRTGPLAYAFRASAPIPPGTPAQAIAERFVSELETMVRKYPLQWFNYYDFWSHADTDRHR